MSTAATGTAVLAGHSVAFLLALRLHAAGPLASGPCLSLQRGSAPPGSAYLSVDVLAGGGYSFRAARGPGCARGQGGSHWNQQRVWYSASALAVRAWCWDAAHSSNSAEPSQSAAPLACTWHTAFVSSSGSCGVHCGSQEPRRGSGVGERAWSGTDAPGPQNAEFYSSTDNTHQVVASAALFQPLSDHVALDGRR